MDATIHSIEELNDLARVNGREGSYRQLGKGGVTSRWRRLCLGDFMLTSHRLDNRIHGHLSPSRGCVAMAIMPQPYFMLVDGQEFGGSQLLVIDAGSKHDFVTPGDAVTYTLIVPESAIVASGQALFPRMHMNTGMPGILQCPSSGWSTLHGEMTGLLRDGRVSPEDLSHLLSRFLALMAGESERRHEKKICLGNDSTAQVARRAQEYIEDHYPHTLQLEDLCRHTGVSIRTLQRAFSRYFQVSPIEYLRVRRLHAVRQVLLTANTSQHNVYQIALDNGFTHHGRFSVYYREYFGESPKETLARDK